MYMGYGVSCFLRCAIPDRFVRNSTLGHLARGRAQSWPGRVARGSALALKVGRNLRCGIRRYWSRYWSPTVDSSQESDRDSKFLPKL